MARQKGIIKLKGTIGDITFYKTRDGYMARERGGIEAGRIASDPAFQRTRENNAEFGRAVKASALLKKALRGVLVNAPDKTMGNRLSSEMFKVIKADLVNERGLRNVIDGEAELLVNFEFNNNSRLGGAFYAPYTGTIDRATGEIEVTIPSFVPGDMVVAPSGATHFKVISAGASVDFESGDFVMETSESAVLAINATATTAMTHTNAVTPASTKPLFLALGLLYYQEVNGSMYPLKNGSFNPLALVQVSGL